MRSASDALDRAWKEARPCFASYAALVLSRDPRSGIVLWLATWVSPYHALAGTLATVAGTLTARCLAYSPQLIGSGYYGYNALLVGLALSHGYPLGFALTLKVLAGAVASTLLTAVLGECCARYRLPVLVLPFVAVATLLSASTFIPTTDLPWLGYAPAHASGASLRWWEIAGQALGGIIFLPKASVGLAVLIAAALGSRLSAALLAAGSAAGVGLGAALAGPDVTVAVAAGYNAALGLAAVATMTLVPGPAALVAGLLTAGLGAWIATAWMLPFSPMTSPVYAWPFVLCAMVILRALTLRPIGGALAYPAEHENNAEERIEGHAIRQHRLLMDSSPTFLPPVEGTWTITQGFDGPHTHKGLWRHGLDFEILDDNGFPFHGYGQRLEDYHCYGRPVLAPGYGTVAAVHDGQPDNPLGSADLQRPWGNAVVIQHGPFLYSVLAHLRPGSIAVKAGDTVVPGQLLGKCGSSGRSPRPHLHLQAQASPVLGAPTVPFFLSHFLVPDGDTEHYSRARVPDEGVRVRTAATQKTLSWLLKAQPERTLHLQNAQGRQFEVEVRGNDANGVVWLDPSSEDELHFSVLGNVLVATTLRASPRGCLAALYQTLACVPALTSDHAQFTERLPIRPLLPAYLRWVHDVACLFVPPPTAAVAITLIDSGGSTIVCTDVEWRVLGRAVLVRKGRADFDGEGLSTIVLYSRDTAAPPLFAAWRSRAVPATDTPSGAMGVLQVS